MQQAGQQDTNAPAMASAPAVAPASASTADPDLPNGAGNDWPTDTPCITKLRNAFVKDADAKGVDHSASLDQTKEWASTCETLGQ
jgi:hypothetical protein